jgi:tetrapyrrole methylase family protein/MazG family protein
MAKKKEFERLIGIMDTLRSKNGCPWDKKQTHKTLLPYLLEEAYEVIEAINNNDTENLREELGDLLLQVVFHAAIAGDKKQFDINGVIKGLNDKLVSRHPHVFADRKGIKTGNDVRDMWEAEKKKTKKRDSVLDGVPFALPALLRSRRLQSKAATTGFKWNSLENVYAKVNEEFSEVREAVESGKKKHTEEEVGDMLFAMVSLSYYLKIDPENALQKANDKFMKRFKMIEKKLGRGISEKEMLELWESTKAGKKVPFTGFQD